MLLLTRFPRELLRAFHHAVLRGAFSNNYILWPRLLTHKVFPEKNPAERQRVGESDKGTQPWASLCHMLGDSCSRLWKMLCCLLWSGSGSKARSWNFISWPWLGSASAQDGLAFPGLSQIRRSPCLGCEEWGVCQAALPCRCTMCLVTWAKSCAVLSSRFMSKLKRTLVFLYSLAQTLKGVFLYEIEKWFAYFIFFTLTSPNRSLPLSLFRHLLLDFLFCPYQILSLLHEFLKPAGCSQQSTGNPGVRPCPASIRWGWAHSSSLFGGVWLSAVPFDLC